MPFDKLGIINDALAQTGNNLVATPDDGSDEWNTASPAYEAAVANTIQARNWNFDTQIATLVRTGNASDDLYNDAMAFPQNCMQLIWVRVNDQPADYRITNNQIELNLDNFTATAKFVIDNGTGAWPPLFAEVIRRWVLAALYRGLNEDPAEARTQEAAAMATLTIAATRVDQQNPKRRLINSRAKAARLVRHPWITTPFDWGGTGVPD